MLHTEESQKNFISPYSLYKPWAQMTPEELKKEFLLCKKDCAYFISHYVKVEHQLLGLVPFDLFDFQRRIIDCILKNRFNILRKFRQAGATTIACGVALWIAVFNRNKTIAILSIGDTESMDVLARIKLMYDELPPFLKPRAVRGADNKHTLGFTNGCRIKSRPSAKSSGRSLASYFLIIDEAAFIESIGEIWSSAYPTISTGGKVLVLSTVNGVGGIGKWYYELYEGATTKANSFNPIEIKWWEHPQYRYDARYEWLYELLRKKDPSYTPYNFEEITKNNIGLRKWRQEYESEFLGTGDTYIDPETLLILKQHVNSNFRRLYNNRLRVWKDSVPQFDYVMGVDTSIGRERDNSAFHVCNTYNGEIVAEFYSNSTPIDEFSKIIIDIAKKYNDAMLVIERNNIGAALIERVLRDHEYENLWWDPHKGPQHIGFNTSVSTREKVLSDMEEAIRNKKILINSERTVKELFDFIIDEHGKIIAEEGQHDDLVMALAFTVLGLMSYLEHCPSVLSKLVNGDEVPISAQISSNKNHWDKSEFAGYKWEDLKWVIS